VTDDPIDEVEMRRALNSIAKLSREFYESLIEEDFTAAQALTLTGEWLRAVSTGGSK
jgi:hypothetical protein